MLHLRTILCFTICLYVQTAFTQTVSYESVIGLNKENEIYESNIRKILQDKFGFKWIVTQESAVRFDGHNINRYTSHEPTDKYRLSGVDIWDVEEDTARNEIYILSSYGYIDVLSSITGSVTRRIKKPEGPESNWFMDMVLTPAHIWLTGFKGVWVYDRATDKFVQSLENRSNAAGAVVTKKIFRDSKENVWTFNDKGQVHVYNDQLTVQNPGGRLLGNEAFVNSLQINDVVSMTEEELLIATSKGMLVCRYGNYHDIGITQDPLKFPFFSNTAVEAICRSGRSLYIATNALYRVSLESEAVLEYKDRYVISQSDWFSSVQSLYADDAGLLWLGGRNGLSYFNIGDKAFTGYYRNREANLGLEHVFYVLPEGDDNYYACCQNGLYKINDRSEIKVLSKNAWYNYMFRTETGTYIVSELKSLKVLSNGVLNDIDRLYSEFRPYKNFSLNSHVWFSDSLLVLGTESFNGILIWDRKKRTIRNLVHHPGMTSLASDVVNSVSRYNDSSVIVLSDKSFAILNIYSGNITNHIIKQKAGGEALGILFDVLVKKEYNLVAAYGVGIVKTDKAHQVLQVFSTSNGLSNNGVYRLFSISDSVIIATTNYGINLINLHTGKISHYTSYDGLHSDVFEEACGTAANGKIVAGGVKGFTKILPGRIRPNNRPPSLYISKIICEYPGLISDSMNITAENYIIGNRILQTSVYFSGINWINPGRTTFAYRILEKSEDWINLNAQNFVTLIGLGPGTYHLQVKAANEDGIWSEPKEITLVFLPKWYQTWWFNLLVILLIAAAIYAFYRYRIAQIKKQHEIRKNIATDLHDDLGSTLNCVKVFTNLAISGVKQEESLQQIKDNLTEATMCLRDMIWVLDDSLDTVDELVTRLKQFALPVAGASNIQAEIKAGSEVNSQKLTKEEKRNLFLVCKEAINNSIKYSGATQIQVDIKPDGKKIRISISDNGKGFDADTVKKGYGLKNMQYRAGQIKYKVSLVSSAGKGTQVEIGPA
ncbi:MAG TPA: triple tyrosine motif-containing protein [Ferruginibacter sp.]|nr:triple tyrosine motif-containing protein [Ferruginibacter sp.]